MHVFDSGYQELKVLKPPTKLRFVIIIYALVYSISSESLAFAKNKALAASAN